MSKLEEAEKLVCGMSRAEKARLLQIVVQDLGDAFPGIESLPGVCGGEPCIVRTRIPLWLFLFFTGGLLTRAFPQATGPDGRRELVVHLVEANNSTPYAFVRAKFEPGEVSDPWAVRFHDQKGKEVPYFVWDSLTWRTAREGRADWGHRFALLGHYPGASPDAEEVRARRLEEARRQLPELGAKLAAREQAAAKFGDSVCAALYLVRHPM